MYKAIYPAKGRTVGSISVESGPRIHGQPELDLSAEQALVIWFALATVALALH